MVNALQAEHNTTCFTFHSQRSQLMSNVQRLVRLAAFLVLTLVFAGLLSSTTATATTRFAACSPVPTPETLSVELVTSLQRF
jgi:hypothetical protein